MLKTKILVFKKPRNMHILPDSCSEPVFENNAEAIYRAMARRLVKGDVRAFKILAERAYGKVKEHVELELTTEGLAERLQAARQRLSETEFTSQQNERERKLGIPNVTVKVLNSVDDDVA